MPVVMVVISSICRSCMQKVVVVGVSQRARKFFHRGQKVYRFYPRDVEAVRALLDPSFDIREIRTEEREYDKEGETEVFCYVIATPKPPGTKMAFQARSKV